MTKVLMIAGGAAQQPAALAEKVRELTAQGSEVLLVCGTPPPDVLLETGAQVREVARHTGRLPLRLRAALSVASPPRRIWLRCRHDREVMRFARSADVIAALDATSVNAAWELAQRYPRPAAVYGLGPALAAERARRTSPDGEERGVAEAIGARAGVVYRSTRQTAVGGAAAVARASLSPRVVRTGPAVAFWRTALSLPKVPDGMRRRLAYVVHMSLVEAKRPGEAARLSQAAVKRLRSASMRSDLLVREANAELALGVTQSVGPAVTAVLAEGDTRLRANDAHRASAAAGTALRLLFHDAMGPALATDPAARLAPLRASRIGAALTAPRGREAGSANPADRVLVVMDGPGALPVPAGARTLNVTEDASLEPFTRNAAQVAESILGGRTALVGRVEGLVGPLLAWASTVLVDGCGAGAALLNLADPGAARVIIAVRPADVVTWWPQLIDFGRVDELIFPSEADRDRALAAFPPAAKALPTRIAAA